MKAALNITFVIICFMAASIAATVNAGDASASATSTAHYLRLDAKGKLPKSTKAANARCIKDSNTGLLWELKTDDGGVHDKNNLYRWGGRGAEQKASIFFDDWNGLIDASNTEKLCGFSDWRVPTIDELKTLILSNGQNVLIDTDYFPLTLASPYWSTSAYTNYPEHAQTVHFGTGVSYYYNGYRGDRLPVRLVRGQ